MSNYLKTKFPNSIEGFKSWCKTFKSLFDNESVKKCYYQNGDYYLEIHKVVAFLHDRNARRKYFLGLTFRKYDYKDEDFINISMDEKEKVKALFWLKAHDFCEENNLMDQFYKEFSTEGDE